MTITQIPQQFGMGSQNRILQAQAPTITGALACLETFYYAFNYKDLKTFKQIWLPNELIQVNNPLGGMIRGIEPISTMYERIFQGTASVSVELSHIIAYETETLVVFAGTETGQSRRGDDVLDVKIRTTRVVTYSETLGQWFLVHHHGSIDDPVIFEKYQHSLKENAGNGQQ